MSGVFGKNIQNLGGGSVGLGLSPAVANINMANNSIINLNQINGQTFPATAGISGYVLRIDAFGNMTWTDGAGPSGPQGPIGPAQMVGGLCGQITFNYDICGDGIGESVGDAGLTYDWCAQVTNICAARILRNISVGGNANVVGTISSGAGENWIGNVKLSAGSISNQLNTTNNIGAWTLNSNSFFSSVTTITASGSISTPVTASSSIAGVYISNTTLSAGNSTIGGIGLSNSLLTASGITVNGTTSITSATTISGLLTVSAAVIQNNLSVGGTFSNTGIATFLSNITVAGTQSNTGAATFASNVTMNRAMIGQLASPSNYALNIVSSGTRTGFISWYCNTNAVPYIGIGWDQSADGLLVASGPGIADISTVNALFVSRTTGFVGVGKNTASVALDVSGAGNFSSNVIIGGSVNILSNLSVSGAFSGTTANLSAITGLSNINGLQARFDSANQVIFVGSRFSTCNLPAGALNVFLGEYAGAEFIGIETVGIGTGAGAFLTGSNNVCIGGGAGNTTTASGNVFIGTNAGKVSSGSTVIGLGFEAAFLNSNSNVIAIGCNAGRGNTFSNTIFLGNAAGYSGPSQANSLTVYSTNTSIPFLFGDLSGRQLGIGKSPSAALDVAGSGIFSGSMTADSAVLQTCSVSGLSTLGSLSVSGTVNVSGLTALSSTTIAGTLSATTLYAPTTNTTTLSVAGLATLFHSIVQNTLSASYLFSSNSMITTLSTTTLSVSGTLTNTTLNICGLATISAASVTNTLSASNIISTIGRVITLSVATFSVSALSTLTNVNVTNTLSSVYLFSSNSFIHTLSALTANISGAFSVSGISTLSNVNVQNTLSSVSLFSSNGLINTFSAATANISGTLGVLGLSTLSNVNVQNTLSSSFLFSTNAVVTGLSATTLFARTLTVSGTTTFPSLSGLTTFNGIPVLLNTVSKLICFGLNTGVRGTDVIALGLSAAWKNSGTHVTGIGCNAVTNNSGNYVIAIGDDTGSSNIGCNVIAIGQTTAWSNTGTGIIAVGDGACTTSSGAGVIAIGSNALRDQGGSNMIGIGTNAGQFNKGNSGIFIGSNAGYNNNFSNALVLGNNPSGSYAIARHNTFLVYSTLCTAPFLQGDMSGILFGIGKVPTTTLDVSGSALITRNLTVSGTATISSGIFTNLSVSGTTSLSALTTSSFGGAGLTTLSSLVVQDTISSSNIYISGTTRGLRLETNVPLSMNSVLTNQGTSTLGGTTVTSLNSLTWPTGTQPVGSVLTICGGATAAYWAVPGAVSLSGWWNVAPNAPLNMNNNGITNLPSINNVQINLNSNFNLIGFGNGVLAGAVSAGGDNIIAIGLSAGAGAAGCNLIYLGNNPGGTQPYDNWFTVYSTTSGLPFLQGDMSNMRLGIGKTPSLALDVSGSAFVSQALNVSGLTTLSNVRAVSLSASTIYSSGTINSSGTATLNAVSIPTTLGVTGTSTLGTTGTGALTASSISNAGTLAVTGQTNLTSAILSSTLNVTGVSTLTRVDGQSINGTSLTSTGTLGVTGTSTLGTTNVGALTVAGTSALGTTTASTLTATSLVAQGTLNAASATSTLGTTTVNTTLNVCGATNLSSAVLSQNLTVCGQTLFRNLSFTSLNSLAWNSPGAGDTVLSVDATRTVLSWVSLTTIGLQNWAQSVANSTISLQGLYGITGITSFNNVSAVFNSALAQIGLGAGALSNNPASNIVAFGTGAGNYSGNSSTAGVYSNNLFLGSNPGGSSNVSNSLVIYSQTNGSPLIYGDLARNQVTIGGQTNTAGYTLNVNGSAQASNFVSPAASSNSIGGVTMSNSILTVGTVCNVTNLNGLNLRISRAPDLIGIGRNMNVSGSSNIAIGDYAGWNYNQTGTDGGNLIAIGALSAFDSRGTSNVGIGYEAAAQNTGSFVNAIGRSAGENNTGFYVNAIGRYAASSNTGSFVNAIGDSAGYQNVSTGRNLIAIGYNAGTRNHGESNIYIGARAGNAPGAEYNSNSCNAIVIGSLAGIAENGIGNANIGNRSINIGTRSSTAQNSDDQIAIGTGTYGAGTGSIAIGTGAFTVGGLRMTVIGSNVSGGSGGNDVIAIGTNAGSNLPALSNNIYIGSNAGYRPTTANTLVVQSTSATAPALQVDLANRRLGVGGAPSYSLDVQTTSTASSNGMRIAQNNTSNVTAGLFLEAGIIPGGGGASVSNTALVSFATRGEVGGGTVIQSLMSVFEGGRNGLSIKRGNTLGSPTIVRVDSTNDRLGVGTSTPGATLDVFGTFNVSGPTTLSGVTLNVLNGVRWPSTAGAVNTQLVISATGQASWQPPGTIDSASWSINPALQTVNMAGFGLTGLTSINGLITTINSTLNQIGIGANLLTNNTANFVVAFGNGAGSNAAADSTWSNCVYLGSNPGTTANGANTFLLYSTTAGVPALQVNMNSRQLGVGKVPTMPLDVLGNGQVTGQFTTQSNLVIGNFTTKTPCNYAINIVASGTRTGYITWYKNDNQVPYIGMGYDQTNDGIGITSNVNGSDLVSTNAFFVSRTTGSVGIATSTPAHALDVAGQINATTAVSTPSLAVSTSTVLRGTLTLPSIASTTYASSVLSYNSTTGAVTQSTLDLGTLGAADSNTMNANWVTTGGGVITWNATTGVVSGTDRILAIPLNKAMGSDGYLNLIEGAWSINLGTGSWYAAYFVPTSVPSPPQALYGSIKVVRYDPPSDQVGSNWIFICSTNYNRGTLKWGPGFITIPSGGVYYSQTGGMSWNVLATATNIALGSNSSITGTTSIVIGSNAASGVAANNVIAIGTNAGSNLPNLSNNIYIGSNAGYNPTTANTLVVQSTSATAPTLQADLANRRLGVGMVPSNALDVSGTIRSSGPVISTLNVAGITSGTSITLTTDNATTYYSITTTTGTTLTLTLPATPPPQGTYWVLKNNAAVNYTFTTTSTNGVFNAGSNSYYLQAGIGITLAYSGTSVNGSPAYYTY
jgi:hypothetical protein